MTKRSLNRTLIWVGVIALLLLITHLTLPYWLTKFLNKRLENLEGYKGHIDHVSLQLYRGAYQLHDLSIVKVDGTKQVPFVRVNEIDISLSWRALFKGAVVADFVFDEPEVNFVDGESEQQSQAGQGADWRKVVNDLTPIVINKVEVHDGTIAFRNFQSTPPVNIQINNVQATLNNLTNVDQGNGRVATLDVTANALNDARMIVNAELDPFVDDDFIVALRCEELSLPMFNDLAKAYAGLDFKGGTGQLVSEIQATDGVLSGYVKPLFKNADIFDWEQDVEDQKDNPFQIAWEAIGGGVAGILTNSDSDKVATRLDFSGQLDSPEIGTWQTIKNTLSNAFLEAYNTRFEGLFKSSTQEAASDVKT